MQTYATDLVIGFCDAGVLRFHENQLLTEEQRHARTEGGEIYALYILEEHQDKGAGRALFQAVYLRIQEKGLRPFLAWALKDNHKARAFYEGQGGGGMLVDEVSL